MTAPDQHVSVRHVVTDVRAAIDYNTTYLGFALNINAVPAVADVISEPAGRQALTADPDGNLIELFQPTRRPEGTHA